MDAGSAADWSRAPEVGRDIEEDFGTRDEEPYEGESEAGVRKVFQRYGLYWDTLSPAQFTQVISSLHKDRHTSGMLGPAWGWLLALVVTAASVSDKARANCWPAA